MEWYGQGRWGASNPRAHAWDRGPRYTGNVVVVIPGEWFGLCGALALRGAGRHQRFLFSLKATIDG